MMEMIKSLIVLSRGALYIFICFSILLFLWLLIWFKDFLSQLISLFV